MACVSIVIPSHQRMQVLATTLADLARQTVDAFECLVILQAVPSDDELAGLYDALPERLRVIYSPEPNASLARNIGLIEASAPVVLFLDDDVRIENPDFLGAHLRNYDDPAIPGVYGQVLEIGQAPVMTPPPDRIEAPCGWMILPANYGLRCRTRNGASNNLSVRRDWALAVGGMDAWFERGARREETEFNLRLTKRYGPLVFDPEASLTHLSADGGSRSWRHVRRGVPMHHIVGHWYFPLAAIRDRTLGWLGLALELRYVATALLRNPQRGWSIACALSNVTRGTVGLAVAARRLAAGPRYLAFAEEQPYRHLELSCRVVGIAPAT